MKTVKIFLNWFSKSDDYQKKIFFFWQISFQFSLILSTFAYYWEQIIENLEHNVCLLILECPCYCWLSVILLQNPYRCRNIYASKTSFAKWFSNCLIYHFCLWRPVKKRGYFVKNTLADMKNVLNNFIWSIIDIFRKLHKN